MKPPHLWEEWCNHGSRHLILSLQRDGNIDRRAAADLLPVHDVVAHLDVGIAVTESRHVRHLSLGQFEHYVSLVIVHLHYVKNGLDFLEELEDCWLVLCTSFVFKLSILK